MEKYGTHYDVIVIGGGASGLMAAGIAGERGRRVLIIEKNEDGITTEEIVVLKTILKKEISQQALHKKINANTLVTDILSGPAKGSIINVNFENVENGTKVTISIDLKLELKAKILEPLIKKWYKVVLTAVLYKMNTQIMQSQ